VKTEAGEYQYVSPEQGIEGDFRSVRDCDLVTQAPVNWRDTIVPPVVKYRLGLQGRFYEMKARAQFFSMLSQLDQAGVVEGATSEYRLARIAGAIQEHLPNLIQAEFPRQDLSRRLAADLFEGLGYAVEVQEGPYERGADLVVMVGSVLLPDGAERRVGVQVFSYRKSITGEAMAQKLSQLLDGWDENQLDSGALLTTGTLSDEAQAVLDEHDARAGDRPVIVLDGARVAELFLQHFGGDLGQVLKGSIA
jgi:hypothetical protein